MSEKQVNLSTLPAPAAVQSVAKQPKTSKALKAALAFVAITYCASKAFPVPFYGSGDHYMNTAETFKDGRSVALASKCPVQPAALNKGTWDFLTDPDYKTLAAERLGGAIRIKTESFDNAPLDAKDEFFNKFDTLFEYLNVTFPKLHEAYYPEFINTHGLLYTIPGADRSLKPIVLMAHQDTVPVNLDTLDRWTNPDPWSGALTEDGWVLGRGATDCKNTLISILAAVEKLAEEGWKAPRDIVLAFGFDEEIGGPRGAGPLADEILVRYGEDGVALIVDEGFTGVDTEYGATFARLGMAEKGAFSLTLSVGVAGGHSSVPPVHTGIGILSYLLVTLESHPFPAELTAGNPLLSYLNCANDYTSGLPKHIKKVLDKGSKKDLLKLGEELAKEDRVTAAWLGTTQAADLITGGVKVNALPEYSVATVNYRINFLADVTSTFNTIASTLAPAVSKFNLTFSVNGSHADVKNNIVKLDFVGGKAGGLEPAPITPAEGPAWELMAGSVKSVWEDAIVTPSGMFANTDTKWSWALTKNIYRFLPASTSLTPNAHTVDEMIHIDGHLTGIQFFYNLMRNTEGWEAD